MEDVYDQLVWSSRIVPEKEFFDMMTAVKATDTMLLAKGGGWITIFVVGGERVVGVITNNRKCVIHDSLLI
jgi:hypothetical protein